MFKDKDERDIVAFASHNAYQPQDVQLEFSRKIQRVTLYNGSKKIWEEVKVVGNKAQIKVGVSRTELVRFER